MLLFVRRLKTRERQCKMFFALANRRSVVWKLISPRTLFAGIHNFHLQLKLHLQWIETICYVIGYSTVYPQFFSYDATLRVSDLSEFQSFSRVQSSLYSSKEKTRRDGSIFSTIRHSLTLNLHAVSSCSDRFGLCPESVTASPNLSAPKDIGQRERERESGTLLSGLRFWQMGN